MERKTVKIWMINVPKRISKTKPKKYKVMGMEAFYKQNHQFYGSIVVNKKYKLLDGYVVYYTAMKNKIWDVPIEVVSIFDRIKKFFRKRVK